MIEYTQKPLQIQRPMIFVTISKILFFLSILEEVALKRQWLWNRHILEVRYFAQ